MANTIDTMSPEEILRGIIDGSLTEFEDENVKSLSTNQLRAHKGITRLILPNLETIPGLSSNVCYDMTNLATVYVHKLSGVLADGDFGKTGLTNITLPAISGSTNRNAMVDIPNMKMIDIGPNCTRMGANGNVGFYNMPLFDTLILRRDGVVAMSYAPSTIRSYAFSSTKFTSGGVLSMYLQPLSRLTRLLRTGLFFMGMAISSCLSRVRSSSTTTQTVLPSNSRTGVMVYG